MISRSVPHQPHRPHRPLQRLPVGGFRAALGRGSDWHRAMTSCLDQLGELGQANLGLIYLSGTLGRHAGPIIAGLRTATGIHDWAGTTASGLIGGRDGLPSDAGLSVLVGRFPDQCVRLFGKGTRGRSAWVRRNRPGLGLVHAAPDRSDLPRALGQLHNATGANLIGGVASGFDAMGHDGGSTLQIGERLSEQGLSGVLFSEKVHAISGLAQGCMPISLAREITKARGQFVLTIDGQPALSVLKQDIGDVLARDIRRADGYIFAGLTHGRIGPLLTSPPLAGPPLAGPPLAGPPLAGQKEAGYLFRKIVATDEETGAIVLSQPAMPGQGILFARRDKESGRDDLRAMLHRLEARLGGRIPQGAIYVTGQTRTVTLFNDGNSEVSEIRRVFGDVPLTGFRADGEFYDSYCYGYAGVLTLFF